MKKVCFIEFEGILAPFEGYKLNTAKAKEFIEKLHKYCEENRIELILISGFHKNIAEKKFKTSFVNKYFKDHKFFYVDEKYLVSKEETDEKLHRDNLEKDKEFNDSYFKQVLIQQFMHDNKISSEDVLLLCNDVWVDAYYTTRFSKVDFAIFEDNVRERGNKIDRINGLAYFNLDVDSVITLLKKFPKVDTSALDKFVYKKMTESLLKDVDFSAVAKKAAEKKIKEMKEKEKGK
jgi:hypothetical protein